MYKQLMHDVMGCLMGLRKRRAPSPYGAFDDYCDGHLLRPKVQNGIAELYR